MPSRRTMSLTGRLLLVTFAVVIVGFLVESTLLLRDEQAVRTQALQTRAELLADLNAEALAAPLWNFEEEAIRSVLDSLNKAPDVLGARVTHPGGAMVAEVGTQEPPREGILSQVRDVVWRTPSENRVIGRLELVMDTSGIDDALRQDITLTLWVVLALLSVVLVAAFVAFRHITQPLDRLTALMRRLSHGEGDVDIPYLDRDDEIGRIAQAVKVFRDTTQERNRLRDNLNTRVEEQTHDLILARDQAETANRVKSEFLSSMSHELRTPLNAIMGFGQLLEIDARKHPDDHRYGDAVQHILSSGGQLLELIDQVLDFARIEQGAMSAQIDDVDVWPIMRAVEKKARPLGEKYKVRLERAEAPCWRMRVMADAAMLQQVLQHLVSNAIKYNRPGGVATLACMVMDDGHLRITVSDMGPGIPADMQKQLFEPFARLGVETGSVEGTGLGLAIVDKLSALMGARINFDTTLGRGSSFWIELPLASGQLEHPAEDQGDKTHGAVDDAVPESLPMQDDAGRLDLDRNLVLYVEDSPANAALLTQYFEVLDDSPDLIVAETGEEGVRIAHERRPAMILMDMNLPGIDGDEALHQIRADMDSGQATVVAVSADAMPEEIQSALAQGFDDYITKPIKLDFVRALIERHLKRSG